MTGIIRFNIFAIQLPGEENVVNVKEVEYIESMTVLCTAAILYSFTLRSLQKSTTDQLALFEQQYDNGYNLLHDEMYYSWVQENHPESAIIDQPQKCRDSTP